MRVSTSLPGPRHRVPRQHRPHSNRRQPRATSRTSRLRRRARGFEITGDRERIFVAGSRVLRSTLGRPITGGSSSLDRGSNRRRSGYPPRVFRDSIPRMTSPTWAERNIDGRKVTAIAVRMASRRWAELVFAVSVRRVSRDVFDPFVGDLMCRAQRDRGPRCPTGAVDVRRSHVRLGITRTVAGRLRARDHHRPQSDHGARRPTGVVDVRRSHVRRGAASLGPSIDRSTATQQPAARRCSRSQFIVLHARHSIGSSATRRAGRLRASSRATIIDRSSTAALDVPRAVNVLRSHALRGAASLGPSVDRSTASQSAAGHRCSRLRSFEALGAGPRLLDRFVHDRPYPIERAPSKQRPGRAPRGGVLVNAIECNAVRNADSVCDSGRSPLDDSPRCMRFVIDVICRVATRVSATSISSLTRRTGFTSRNAFATQLETKFLRHRIVVENARPRAEKTSAALTEHGEGLGTRTGSPQWF